MDTASSSQPQNALAGIFWMVLSGLCFVGVTGIVRHIGSSLPAVEMAFLRYAFGVVLIVPALVPLVRKPPSMRRMGFFATRGVLHGTAVMLWFYAMTLIPIAEVTALGYLVPIFVAIGAALFLGEKLYSRRIISIVIGFVGAVVILRPGFQELNTGQLAQLVAAPMLAASFIMAKRMTQSEETSAIVAMLTLFCALALAPGALYFWQPPSFYELAWLAAAATSATLGHVTMTRAFKAAPITVTQPLSFLQLVWATILGVALFGEPVDPFVILGGAIVVAAVSYISHREAAAQRRRTALAAVREVA